MTLLIYNILMFTMIFFDVRHYSHQVTPLTIIGSIYTLLIDLNNLFLTSVYGFNQVEEYVLWILLLFFFVIFIVDLLFGFIYKSTRKIDKNITARLSNFQIVNAFFVSGILAYGIQFFRLVFSRGFNIKGLNNGFLGHLSSFAFVLGPVVVDLAIQSKKKQRLIISVILNVFVLVISVLFGGKYVIYINLTYFILYFLLKRNKKIEIVKIIKIGTILFGSAIGVFFLLYYIIPRVTGQYNASSAFPIQHLFNYLVGPIVAQNTAINRAGEGNPLIPFTVFINIIKAIIGDHDYVSSIFPFVFNIKGVYMTNVAGYFGETIYCLGNFGALIYTILVFVIINFFFLMYRTRNMFYLSFCYSCAMLVFLFFGNYITVSGVVLRLLLALAIDFISICKFGKVKI